MVTFGKTLIHSSFINLEKKITGKIEEQASGEVWVSVDGRIVYTCYNYNDAVRYVKEKYN